MSTGPLTTNLIQRASKLLHIEDEVSDSAKLYSAFDDGGVEIEVGELLYSFVRVLKPQFVLESGTYSGISAAFIGQAMRDNGFGHLTTLEFEQFHIQRARELWGLLGLENQVQAHLGPSLDYQPDREYGLILLDTEPAIRFAELERFYPYLLEGGYIFIHDLPRGFCQGNINPDHPEIASYPFGDVPEQMKELIRTDKLRIFSFPSPRGMVGFYKPKAEDYRP